MNVYLDNNATTKPLPQVVEAVMSGLTDGFANPSSPHQLGLFARMKVEQAREAVAQLIGSRVPSDIIFTSGGTESISQVFAIACVQAEKTKTVPSLIHSSVEHAAVLDAAAYYAVRGAQVREVRVDVQGHLDLSALKSALADAPRGSFVFLMLANNETGVIFQIKEAAALCKSFGAFLHVDAVQAAGKIPINVDDLGCDYLSLSAHKFHGLKGTGALYIRRGCPRAPLIKGHQESRLRGGTENVPGIIGMGKAAQVVTTDLNANASQISTLRDQFEKAILESIPGTEVNGDRSNRLINTTNIFFPGKNSASLAEQLSAREIFVSAGAACTTGGKPSHVLQAMGLGEKRANSSLRFSLSKFSSETDIESAIKATKQVFSSSLDVHEVS